MCFGGRILTAWHRGLGEESEERIASRRMWLGLQHWFAD